MRLVFKEDYQRLLLTQYKQKGNYSWRQLSSIFEVDWKTLRWWRDEKGTLPKRVFEKIVKDFPEISSYKKYIKEEREDYWWKNKVSKLGGEATKKKIASDDAFRKKWIEKCKKGGLKAVAYGFIRNWDVGFRKIGKRKTIGPKGERMFNNKERSIAIFLMQNDFEYVYEPLINLNSHSYFPDFLVGNTIIERCGLWSEKYLKNIKQKCKDYLKWDGMIILATPKKMMKKMKEITPSSKKFIVMNEECLDDLKSVLRRRSWGFENKKIS